MLLLRAIGALLVVAGVVWLVVAAIRGGRLSDPGPAPGTGAESLEPPKSGLRAMATGRTWPALALVAAGLALLLLPALIAPPPPS